MSINTAKAAANGSVFHAMRDATIQAIKKETKESKRLKIVDQVKQRLDLEYNARRAKKASK